MRELLNSRCAPCSRRDANPAQLLLIINKRVMTDTGPAYRSGEFDALLEGRGIRHRYTRPLGPWQNGKVGRMNRTIAQEWQYGRAWGSEAERAEALPAFIEHYNCDRPHSACGGLPPMSRIDPDGVSNLMAHNRRLAPTQG